MKVYNDFYGLYWDQIEIACHKTNYGQMLKDVLKLTKKENGLVSANLAKKRVIAFVAEGYKTGSGHTEEGSTICCVLGTTLGAWLRARGVKFETRS